MKHSSILAVVSVLFHNVLGSGFGHTCHNINLDSWKHDGLDHYYLKADCVECDGARDSHVQLDLGGCIANRNGQMVPAQGGAFWRSCGFCWLSGVNLTCSCRNSAGQAVLTQINLNDFIGNHCGILHC
ncbi:Cyanovirin-N [Parathielavia hyrcaniae]|uniref:Cyanovirin-N n=1 Tax=Parathielavia hyrcaniae TaxID=113614 RepID=A0AAN6PQ58_9PEZI|nr:Cyanovirin-N [Parathielavia hyrcaniae]